MPSHQQRRTPLPPDYQFPTNNPKAATRMSVRFVKQYDIVSDPVVRRWNCYTSPCTVCGGPVVSQGYGNVIMRRSHVECRKPSADATGEP